MPKMPRNLATASALVCALLAPSVPGAKSAEPPPTMTVEGIVEDAAGQPVPGALVWAAPDTGPGEWVVPLRVETDVEGRFAVEVTGDPPVSVYVRADGFADARMEATPERSSLEVQLVREQRADGVVLDSRSGEPVSAASVRVARPPLRRALPPRERREVLPSASTDDDGRFELGRLAPGVHDVIVTAEGYTARIAEVQAVPPAAEPGSSSESGAKIQLGAGLSIRGRVVDAAGEPVVGARVRARADRALATVGDFSEWLGSPLLSTRTAADGSFELPGVPEAQGYALEASGEGLADTRVVGVEPGPGPVVEGVEIRMTPGGALQARLVDPDGEPISGKVAVEAAYPDRSPEVGRRPHRVSRTVRADERGQLRLDHLPPGEPTITVHPDGFGEVGAGAVTVSEGRTADLGQLEAAEGAGITVRVRGPEGEPVPGARLRLRGGSRSGFGMTTGETRDDGTFRFGGLEAGSEYDLRVRADGYGTTDRNGVTPGEQPLQVRLGPAARVEGRVVSQGTGKPVPRYEIEVVPVDAADGGLSTAALMRRLMVDREEVTDPSGRFELDDLAGGEYRLRLRAPGHVPRTLAEVSAVAGETTDLGEVGLDPGTTVRGTVLDAETGEPVAGASVSLKSGGLGALVRRARGGGAAATTDDEGDFVAGGIPSGTRTLVIDHPEYASTERRMDIDPAGPSAPIEVRLGRGGAIEGVVRDAQGRPVEGARVMAVSGVGMPDPGSQAVTDELGRYRIEHLEPGTVRVMVVRLQPAERGSGRAVSMQGTQTETVEVVQGETTSLSFPSSGGGLSVNGRVMLADGTPLEASLSWFPGEGRGARGQSLATARSAADGTFTVQLPGPGRYRVVARELGEDPMQAALYVMRTEVADAPGEELELRAPETRVSGRATGAARGEPLEGVQVVARSSGDDLSIGGRTSTDRDGRYALEGMAPGTYHLVFTRSGYAMQILGEMELDADDQLEDRDVVLARAASVAVEVVDGAGQPIPGAWLFRMPEQGPGHQRLGTTDADGRAVVDVLPDGSHRIAVWAAGQAPTIGELTVPAGEGTAQLFELGPGVPLTVRVRGAGDEPLEAARISVSTGDGTDLTELIRQSAAASGEGLSTGPDGRVELPPLAPGRYRVTATLGELETTEEIELEQDQEDAVELELR